MSAWNIKICYNDYEFGHSHIAVIYKPKPEDAVAVGFPKAPVLVIKVEDGNSSVKSIAMMDPCSYGCADGRYGKKDNMFVCYQHKSIEALFYGNIDTQFYRHLARVLHTVQEGDKISMYYASRKSKFSNQFFQSIPINLEGAGDKEIKMYFVDFIQKYYPKCSGGFYDLKVSSDYFALTGDGSFREYQLEGVKSAEKWQLGEKRMLQEQDLEGKIKIRYLCDKPLPCEDESSDDEFSKVFDKRLVH